MVISTALTGLFSVIPLAVFRFIYSPAIGMVPGAVATGSMAPGRYRSRYRSNCKLMGKVQNNIVNAV